MISDSITSSVVFNYSAQMNLSNLITKGLVNSGYLGIFEGYTLNFLRNGFLAETFFFYILFLDINFYMFLIYIYFV